MLQVRDPNNGNTIHLPAIKGKDGKCAYQYAVEGGFKGTKEEFINLLLNNTDIINNHLTDINAHTDIRKLIAQLREEIEINADGNVLVETAEAGQMVVVKAVDENGTPTEFEAVDVIPEIDLFTLGVSNIKFDSFSALVCDESTCDTIKEALEEYGLIKIKIGINYNDSIVEYYMILQTDYSLSSSNNIRATGVGYYGGLFYLICTFSSNRININLSKVETDIIKTIADSAEVGQVITVKAVDSNGTPTEFEAKTIENIGSSTVGIKVNGTDAEADSDGKVNLVIPILDKEDTETITIEQTLAEYLQSQIDELIARIEVLEAKCENCGGGTSTSNLTSEEGVSF